MRAHIFSFDARFQSLFYPLTMATSQSSAAPYVLLSCFFYTRKILLLNAWGKVFSSFLPCLIVCMIPNLLITILTHLVFLSFILNIIFIALMILNLFIDHMHGVGSFFFFKHMVLL